MKTLHAWALLCVLLAGSGRAIAAPSALDDSERGSVKPANCAHVRTEAVYRAYGYDHEVVIENACDKALTCSVKTDANPEPTSVKVAARGTERLVTFRGSPAREFSADVQCKTDT